MQQQYYGVNTHPVMTTIEEEDLVQLFQEHHPLKTKTIEDLRLTLMTVPVYHHLNM
jgi:hypothetical protein